MSRLTTIEITKEYLNFSAAHFTIFSATDRERLHGHNFRVAASITAPVDDNGLCFNYVVFKQYLKKLCDSLDEYTLIAAESPHLQIEEQSEHYLISFAGKSFQLLRDETLLLPIRNTTVEELSHYLLQRILADKQMIESNQLQALEIKVFSGPGQSGSACWAKA